MARMTVNIYTYSDKESVVLQLEEGEKIHAHVMLDGASAEQVAAHIAKHRAELTDVVSPEIDPGFRLEAIHDPAWRGQPYRVAEGRIVSIRHPGYGWLSFVISDDSAKKLAEELVKDLPHDQSKIKF